MSNSAVHAIIDALGSDAIGAELQLTSSSIKEARRSGLFPARWYAPLRALCEREGVNCPMSAFRWIESGKNSASGQAEAE